MSQVILTPGVVGNVAVTFPAEDTPISDITDQFDEQQVSWVLVDLDSLPHRYNLFFDAWRFDSAGTGVEIDLTESKTIAIVILRNVAIRAKRLFEEREFLGFTNPFTSAEVGTQLSTTIANVNAQTNIEDLFQTLEAFMLNFNVDVESDLMAPSVSGRSIISPDYPL